MDSLLSITLPPSKGDFSYLLLPAGRRVAFISLLSPGHDVASMRKVLFKKSILFSAEERRRLNPAFSLLGEAFQKSETVILFIL